MGDEAFDSFLLLTMQEQMNLSVYEEPLNAQDGMMLLPDFTVKFRGEIYYWEHMKGKTYRQRLWILYRATDNHKRTRGYNG